MRFLDNINDNADTDFIARTYTSPVIHILVPFVVAMLAVVAGIEFHEELGGTTVASIITVLFLLGIGALTYMKFQQTNDLVMASDFQNLLFAAASALGSRFCFFVRRDGTIVYANDGTRQLFPKFAYEESRALDAILDEGGVQKEDRNKLYSALTRATKEHLVFTLNLPQGGQEDFIFIIEPLQRPSGYFVVHGRKYYKERSAKATLPGNLHLTAPEKVHAVMENIPLGIYITNETGRVEYVNRALDEIMRFNGKMLEHQLGLTSIIYHADRHETGEFDVANYTGNILLSTHNGNLAKANLQQFLITDDAGSVTGCFGIVTPAG